VPLDAVDYADLTASMDQRQRYWRQEPHPWAVAEQLVAIDAITHPKYL
jgi:hypothetical protein